MVNWEIRTFAAAAVITAAIPVITYTLHRGFVHSPLSGFHVRVQLPGGWVTEWRLEADDRHAASTAPCPLALRPGR